MDKFSLHETVILSAEVKVGGALTDPDSITATVDVPRNGREVEEQAMVKDAVGKYHYDFYASSKATAGESTFWCTVTISGRTVIEELKFLLG